jgi:hypothetical protein
MDMPDLVSLEDRIRYWRGPCEAALRLAYPGSDPVSIYNRYSALHLARLIRLAEEFETLPADCEKYRIIRA